MDIVTITLNPALDLTTRLEVMHPGEVNLVSEANLRAAGKGINVAMVLKDLGRDVGLTGWLGEGNQQSFVSLFEERALADHFVRVAGDTRINVKISEQSGRVTDLVSDIDGWENPVDPDEYFEIIGRAIWYGKEL